MAYINLWNLRSVNLIFAKTPIFGFLISLSVWTAILCDSLPKGAGTQEGVHYEELF
jgi:hypothetical protein